MMSKKMLGQCYNEQRKLLREISKNGLCNSKRKKLILLRAEILTFKYTSTPLNTIIKELVAVAKR